MADIKFITSQGRVMSAVYNPEAEVIAQIERFELEARDLRRRVERAVSANDRRVLNRQLQEIKEQIEHLKHRVP